MSQLGPAPAQPLNETQAKAKAIADLTAAEAEAKNAAHAAHDANMGNIGSGGPYGDLSAKALKLQEAANAERYAPDNAPTDANADKAEAEAKKARSAAEKEFGKDASNQLPPAPEYDPNVPGKGKR